MRRQKTSCRYTIVWMVEPVGTRETQPSPFVRDLPVRKPEPPDAEPRESPPPPPDPAEATLREEPAPPPREEIPPPPPRPAFLPQEIGQNLDLIA